ncbi:MAG: HAD hydrolase family protein [Selenomonadaceae bacterium]|nr:HAD hydrolase family protein [Selenomonadaceae bacterium]
MRYELNLFSTIKRIDWIKGRYNVDSVIYMGDGIFDHYVMKQVGYSIATGDADENAKKYADYVTKRHGGKRAVAEAALHILDKFFVPYNENEMPNDNINNKRDWTV